MIDFLKIDISSLHLGIDYYVVPIGDKLHNMISFKGWMKLYRIASKDEEKEFFKEKIIAYLPRLNEARERLAKLPPLTIEELEL